ncbi:FixH family protein [Pseudomonadota bacterium]
MLESMLALPLSAAAAVLLFALLYGLSPMNGRQVAVVVALVSLAMLLMYSLVDWPGGDVLAMYVAVLMVTAYLLGIVSHARETRGAGARGRWFHWAPAVIVIFFALLFALDGVLVVVSKQGLPDSIANLILPEPARQNRVRSVFPGTVANDFQKKEGLYNEYLQQVERQQQRGWQVNKGWLQAPVADRPAAFQVQVLEPDGAAVQYAEISGQFQRPSDSKQDTAFDMREVEPGVYRVVLTLPEPGVWALVLKIRRGQQLHEVHASTSVKVPAALLE